MSNSYNKTFSFYISEHAGFGSGYKIRVYIEYGKRMRLQPIRIPITSIWMKNVTETTFKRNMEFFRNTEKFQKVWNKTDIFTTAFFSSIKTTFLTKQLQLHSRLSLQEEHGATQQISFSKRMVLYRRKIYTEGKARSSLLFGGQNVFHS